MSDGPINTDPKRIAEYRAQYIVGLSEVERVRELRELKHNDPTLYTAVLHVMWRLREVIGGGSVKVILVGLDGVHLGEYDVLPCEPPNKIVALYEPGSQPNTRYFSHRTGNYYDEVVPATVLPKPPKV